ncbi:MAG: orc1/cdc6 family replication initiation protein [Candidatus Thermoplasmatota archaeon]|nr:orc1/cdc6 family replication initiation protein [Candidatus Thermoplasmatota archaeon]
MEREMHNLFDRFQYNSRILKGERKALDPGFVPDRLPHRESEAEKIAEILVPSLSGQRPSNIIIFGKPGVGKTSVMQFVEREANRVIDTRFSLKLKIININCGVIDNPYGILLNIGNHLLGDWEDKLPFTGWPIDKLFNVVQEKIDNFGGIVIVVMDEIDRLVKKSGDGVLYQLLRINETSSAGKLSIIGISNDLRFTDYLDPRVKSRLIEETLVFPPYNATQIYDILRDRSLFSGILDSTDDSALQLCAAIAAQDQGDARRAIDLLRISVELAEMKQLEKINDDLIYEAKKKLERDIVTETISTLPLHSKIALLSIVLLDEIKRGTKTSMGEVYDLYCKATQRIGVSSLTPRRIADIVGELTNLGLVDSVVQSFGRYGRTTMISMNYDGDKIKELLMEDDSIGMLQDVKPSQKSLTES